MRQLEADDADFDEQVGDLKGQADAVQQQLKREYAAYQAAKSERAGLHAELQVRRVTRSLPWHLTATRRHRARHCSVRHRERALSLELSSPV